MIESMAPEKIILYPQLFWGCVALLHADLVPIYTAALRLLTAVMDRLTLSDRTAHSVLLSSRPTADPAPAFSGAVPPLTPDTVPNGPATAEGLGGVEGLPPAGKKPASHALNKASSESLSTEASFVSASNQSVGLVRAASGNLGASNRSLPTLADVAGEEAEAPLPETPAQGPPPAALFEDVQPLILKGLLSPVSHAAAIAGLSRITLLPGDGLFGPSAARLPMHITGLLPWLCLRLHAASPTSLPPFSEVQPGSPSARSDALADAGWGAAAKRAALAGAGEEPEPRRVASNLAQACQEQGLTDLASAFAAYAEGGYTSAEQLVGQVGAPSPYFDTYQ